MDLKELGKPFPASDIEWRVQRSGVKNGKPWAMVLAYVTNRAILERLDKVCGHAGWQNKFIPGPTGGVLCGISIKCGSEWITKWDGADNTEVEAIKGGLSSAMKRAGSQWDIGRYLYNLEATFANVVDKGSNRGVAKDPDGKRVSFQWNDPQLPKWALPEGEAPKNETKQTTTKPPIKTPADAEATVSKIDLEKQLWTAMGDMVPDAKKNFFAWMKAKYKGAGIKELQMMIKDTNELKPEWLGNADVPEFEDNVPY